jgi:peptidoglycan/xylan/chitin deacetylase (PgdA/CDA1 family)
MQWKDDADCAVLLTFDIDGPEMWRARAAQGAGPFDKPPTVSMGEYGVNVAVPRILEMLDDFGVPAGFFIPGKVAEENRDLVLEIHERGHEIGHHSYAHVNPTSMSDEEEREDFERAMEVLTDITGERPVGYRTPAADMSDRTLNRIARMGFEYESTMMGNDVPYFLDTEEGRIVELPFHWSTDDAPFFNYNSSPPVAYQTGMATPSDVYEIWTEEFDACREWGLLLNLAMHPQIIGRPHRLKMLERVLRYISGHDDVWIGRPKEVARYWRAQQDE